jgi:nucleoside-triphosphatase THEP1
MLRAEMSAVLDETAATRGIARRWALVAGRRGTGRIERLEAAIEALRARGLVVGGVVQRARDDAAGKHAGYDALALADGRSVTLARPSTSRDTADPTGRELICSYAFDTAAFGEARAWVERDAARSDVVVVDEVSKLEVGRGGHHGAIEAALAGHAVVLLSVREEQLFAVMDRFGLEAPVAALEGSDGRWDVQAVEAFAAAIAASVRTSR